MSRLLLPALPWALLALHVAAAVLASYRLTELILADKIAEPIRKRFGRYYLFSCPRCMSVWCGAAVTAAFALVPWLNWPLALSWIYIAAKDGIVARRPKPLVSTGPQPTRQRGQHMASNDRPRPLDPELAAKLAALNARQAGQQPSQARPATRTPDAIIKEHLGGLMLQVITLQAENEQLRARVAELTPQQAPVAEPAG